MRSIEKKLDKEQMAWFFTICWRLRTSRNKALMEEDKEEPMEIIQAANSLLQAFKATCGHSRKTMQEKGTVKWSPPPMGTIKINFDGALFTDPCGARAGFMARDADGFRLA
ncbi:hypothetical protein Salat_2921400 [Sesamum alatum]|uniref:RNase H type-1 domain-containing protein n=1 Tax=Sesamum alatum TaxID=300844 RepID=A0AAE2C8B4_9LAMI|nr:hypothetical protein Salat_2921400 [Sesamum alatum]